MKYAERCEICGIDGKIEYVKEDLWRCSVCGYEYSKLQYLSEVIHNEYDFNELTGTILKYNGTCSELNIPSHINGFPVLVIERLAFERHVNLTEVSIPDSVCHFGLAAFLHCHNFYNKYKLPKKIPIHFFGETILKINDLMERYQFIGSLIFRVFTRRKTRAGPFTKIKNSNRYM